jgi:ribosomal protein S18 acetylase RimI-like enzyme
VRAAEFEGRDDLASMQRLVQASWAPGARWHVGDLAWQRRRHPDGDASWPTRLWRDDEGEPRAWAWVRPDDGELDLVVHPRDDALAAAVLEWAVQTAGAATLTVRLGHADAWLAEPLGGLGFAPAARSGFHLLACAPVSVAAAPVAAGFALRGLAPGDDDRAARVAGHRAAWAPGSSMTESAYATLQATWPYRHDLDVVAQDQDGRLVASCLAWYDDATGVGLLEPVGTDPAFRRLGLAAAVCAEAVRRLGACGAHLATVAASDAPDYTGPVALYRSIGFVDVARTTCYARS